jgi:AraC family ethanolamine operon transcriptional activator
MTTKADAGTIQIGDIEELNYAVWPWELRMRQLSSGRMLANLEFAQVDGILLTHERWSKRVFAMGATPRGYLALAGICAGREFSWCGASVRQDVVSCGLDGTDIEFGTPDAADHWVLLVPTGLLTGYLGDEETADLLPKERSLTSPLTSPPQLVRQLGSLVLDIITLLRSNSSYRSNRLLLDAFRLQLLAAVTALLACADEKGRLATTRTQYAACRRALHIAETLRQPISIDELAAAVGISRRGLELGFREVFDISPQRYLRRIRMNGLRRDLRRAVPGRQTIAEAAGHWGFVELGRTAVEYRQLFGESPSTTLAREARLDCRRYSDALTLRA